MKTLLQQILVVAGIACLTVGGTSAQNKPSASSPKEPFKTQYILGLNFMPEWSGGLGAARGGSASRFSPNVGLSFEVRITKHSGIETGLYYRNVRFDVVGPVSRTYSDRYFSIPLLYKYYSRIINIGAGINYDFRFSQTGVSYQSGKHRVGIMLKVSKDIQLCKGLLLEPEFHFNPFWSNGGGSTEAWVGFQIGLKYRFK